MLENNGDNMKIGTLVIMTSASCPNRTFTGYIDMVQGFYKGSQMYLVYNFVTLGFENWTEPFLEVLCESG